MPELISEKSSQFDTHRKIAELNLKILLHQAGDSQGSKMSKNGGPDQSHNSHCTLNSCSCVGVIWMHATSSYPSLSN